MISPESARCLHIWRVGFEPKKITNVLRLEWENKGVMDGKRGDDDTGEVRRLWRSDESGRGRLRRG